ncbi:MAG: quinate 5-dehydrogenase [Thermaerobacter sp.]
MSQVRPVHIVGVSIGLSRRDHRVEIELLGRPFIIERRGTDGDIDRAIALIRELDGKVDAFGMGGLDLYVVAGQRRYVLRDALRIARAATKTPIVDGSGLKNTLERRVIRYLRENGVVDFAGKKVLMVSAVDRFGMAEELARSGCDLVLGDLMFILGLPIPLRSLRALDYAARVIGPIACRLPIHMLYPTGKKQEINTPRHSRYFHEAHIVTGDFHFIRRYMPERLDGKIVITNTVTRDDLELMRERGVATLITTTPELEGRSFGTNIMEAVLVAASGRRPEDLTPADYERWLDRLDFRPRIERLR